MPLTRRICISLVICATLAVLITGSSYAIPTGNITEVTVSPDLRRVTVKSDGVIGPHTISTENNPSRLIIDVQGVGLAKAPQMNGASKDAGLAVKIAKSQSGARVVLDFGASSLPEHKIRRLGNYLLVFLQEWQPKPALSGQSAPEKASLPKASATPTPTPTPVVRRNTEKPHHGSSPEVSIKSAEVVDGLVVLTLASRQNPGVTYRIDLGVDFEKLGFSTAKISTSGTNPSQKFIKVSSRRSPFWQEEAPQLRIGPRKSPPQSTTVQENEARLERTAKLSGPQW